MNSSVPKIQDSAVTIRHRMQFLFSDNRHLPPVPVDGWDVSAIDAVPDGVEALSFQSYINTHVQVEGFGTQSIDGVPFRISGVYLIVRKAPEEDVRFELLPVHPNLEGKVWVMRRRAESKAAA